MTRTGVSSFSIQEGQRKSGANTELLFGRNEGGAINFHKSVAHYAGLPRRQGGGQGLRVVAVRAETAVADVRQREPWTTSWSEPVRWLRAGERLSQELNRRAAAGGRGRRRALPVRMPGRAWGRLIPDPEVARHFPVEQPRVEGVDRTRCGPEARCLGFLVDQRHDLRPWPAGRLRCLGGVGATGWGWPTMEASRRSRTMNWAPTPGVGGRPRACQHRQVPLPAGRGDDCRRRADGPAAQGRPEPRRPGGGLLRPHDPIRAAGASARPTPSCGRCAIAATSR